jgi:hypothetical protein
MESFAILQNIFIKNYSSFAAVFEGWIPFLYA